MFPPTPVPLRLALVVVLVRLLLTDGGVPLGGGDGASERGGGAGLERGSETRRENARCD